ncbi:XisI protein [Nodosilinea sp. E11]|uniref:XisI protein n=1 Tax=Nodosilinea sp. E11 TaxID=3037479 RepID=UPI002934C9B1|nr:XisI protein [Nodosilinea sp. E11]WOD40808.1 XisI protein [Nodosilinea sp. E11]
MDKLTEYPQIIKKILTEHAEICDRYPNPNIKKLLILDEERGHYIWMTLGWQKGERIAGMTIYARVLDGKFWIEEDLTEEGVATDLMRMGVAKEGIVLAFHEPNMRQYTDFAVA